MSTWGDEVVPDAAEDVRACGFRLVAVTERSLCAEPLAQRVARLALAGFDRIVVREKDLDAKAYVHLLERLLAQAEDAAAPEGLAGLLRTKLVVHSHVEAACALGIPRVHVPLSKLQRLTAHDGAHAAADACNAIDAPVADVRCACHVLAGFEEVGTSVHSIEEVMLARSLGATQLFAGHVFPTDCKPGLAPRGLDFLRAAARAAAPLDVCAIGGVGVANVALVVAAGARGACLRSSAMTAEDPAALAASLRRAAAFNQRASVRM